MSRTLFVRDLMKSPVIHVTLGATLSDAEKTMRRARIRHLPVTDQAGRLIGLVTQRSLLAAWVGHGNPLRENHAEVARDISIEMLMVRDVVTLPPQAPAAEAARLLLEDHIGCVPVVGAEETVVGILTAADFVRFAKIYLELSSKRVRAAFASEAPPAMSEDPAVAAPEDAIEVVEVVEETDADEPTRAEVPASARQA